MTNDAGTLATALYATAGDMLKEHPGLAPWRPPVGTTPRLSDAERLTLATMQAIPGCSKRLRKAAGLMRSVNRILATTTSVRSEDVRGRGLPPVECGRSRETVRHSDLAGWARYG